MDVEDHDTRQNRAEAVQLIKIARRKLSTSKADEIAAIYLDHALTDLNEREDAIGGVRAVG